jgi:hypothetical protein
VRLPRTLLNAGTLLALLAAPAIDAQANSTLRQAIAAYDNLQPAEAIKIGKRALAEKLSPADRARAYELLGFAYASLDSTRQASDAFRNLVLIDADRELDPGRISPKITGAFTNALATVLVVRHAHVDSTSFVVGAGALPIEFIVTRPSRVRTSIAGGSREALVDSSVISSVATLRWNGLMNDGQPPHTGTYRVLIEAATGGNSYARALTLKIVASPVDTLDHLTSLPGYSLLPEMTEPPRSWRPFGIAALLTAGVAGATLALENPKLGGGSKTPILVVSASALLIGGLAVAQKPALVPNTANIRYNNLVKEQLAKQNREIASENVRRRTEVRLTITEEPKAGGGT